MYKYRNSSITHYSYGVIKLQNINIAAPAKQQFHVHTTHARSVNLSCFLITYKKSLCRMCISIMLAKRCFLITLVERKTNKKRRTYKQLAWHIMLAQCFHLYIDFRDKLSNKKMHTLTVYGESHINR